MSPAPRRAILVFAVLLFASVGGCAGKPSPEKTSTSADAAVRASVVVPVASASADRPAEEPRPARPGTVKAAPGGSVFGCVQGRVSEGIGMDGASAQEIELSDAASSESTQAAAEGLCARQAGLDACIEAERTAKRKLGIFDFEVHAKDGAVSTVTGARTELASCLQSAFAGAPSGGAKTLRYSYFAARAERRGPNIRVRDAKAADAGKTATDTKTKGAKTAKMPPWIADSPGQAVARVAQTRGYAMRKCQATAIAVKPSTAGAVTLELSLDPTGKTTKAVPSQDTLGDARLTACLVATTKDLQFPNPTGEKATVSYKIELSGD